MASDENDCRLISCDNGNDYDLYLLQNRTSEIEVNVTPSIDCRLISCDNGNDYDTYLLEDLPLPVQQTFFNDPVFFGSCPGDTTLMFSGTLPSWITIVGNQLVGAAGTFQASSKELANSAAQQALDAFGNAALLSGDLTCEGGPASCDGTDTNQYTISPYSDGDVANTLGSPPAGGEFVFAGDFPYKGNSAPCLWMSNFNGGQAMIVNGKQACLVIVTFSFVFGVWQLQFLWTNGDVMWSGRKTTGNSPAGVYTIFPGDGGVDAGPATLTIVLGVGSTTDQAIPNCGSS